MGSRVVALVVGQLQLGGAERQLFELATRLDTARYRPCVICLSEVADPYAGLLRERGIEVVLLRRHGHRDLMRAGTLGALIRRRRFDLVHSFLIAANAYAYVACRLAGGPAFIASSRTCIPPRGWLATIVHRRAFHGATAVIANSRRVRAFTSEVYRLAPERIQVIPNGVTVMSDRDGARVARETARAGWGIGPDELLVGTVGRLSPEKNPGLFIEVAAQRRTLSTERQERFVLVGDGPARAALERQVHQAGLDRVVTFAGARREVERLLPAFDLFMTTSDTEGLPNAVMEAMAAGLAVVATRVGGTEEIVVEGETGYLVDPGDLSGLCDRLHRLAADPELRVAMGERGRDRIGAEFSNERMVERTMDLYDAVLG